MKVTPCKYHNLERWRVDWRESGHRGRKFFETKEDANNFARNKQKELDRFGQSWMSIPDLDRAQLVECWKRAQDGGYDIAAALRFWERHNPNSSLALDEVVDRFLESKQRKRLAARSYRGLKEIVELFTEDRGDRPVASITQEEVEEFINNPAWGDWRRRGAIIDLGNLFNWALKKKLIAMSPMSGIDKPIINDKAPEILSVEDAASILKVCQKYPAILPAIVISLFAGLRTAEVLRLRWENLKASFIELGSHQTKGRQRRLVTIRETLAAWLEGHRKDSGPIWPAGAWYVSKQFRAEVAGLPKNVLRHSFISYALGAGETIDRVAMESGNTPDVIFKHYRELVTPEQAGMFWGLRPA